MPEQPTLASAPRGESLHKPSLHVGRVTAASFRPGLGLGRRSTWGRVTPCPSSRSTWGRVTAVAPREGEPLPSLQSRSRRRTPLSLRHAQ